MPAPPSLAAAFLQTAERAPERRAILFEDRSLSYRALLQEVRAVASSLRAWGLKRGERVALYLENSPSFVAAYLGALWLGAVVVPVNTRYRETELAHMLGDSSARLVVTDAARAKEVAKCSTSAAFEGVLELAHDASDLARWRALAQGANALEPAPLGPDDLAVIGYTSGTTGRSKGAMLTHGNFVSNSLAVTEAWGWTPQDRLLLALPLFHMHGLGVGLHGSLMQGSTIRLLRSFEAAAVYDALLADVSMFFGVPTMYSRLLEQAAQRLERPQGLRLLVSGSAPLSPLTLANAEEVFGLRILERYGMTETVMNLGNPLRGPRKAGSVGLPFDGVALRIVRLETNETVSAGETGELQLRGPNVCKGYWRDAEATRAAFEDGWFKTGDLGYQDEDGYVYLTGRAKELIISGGFNVYPREVEEVLETHAGVLEAAVLGLPDPDLGEKVVAVVVGEASAAELQAYCGARLAGFKKPKTVYFAEALPRNALGKVQKHLLRERLWQRGRAR